MLKNLKNSFQNKWKQKKNNKQITIGVLIRKFIQFANLDYSVDEIIEMTVEKAIELLHKTSVSHKYNNDKTNTQRYIEEFMKCKDENDLAKLLKKNKAFYAIFISALMVVFEEITRHDKWTNKQRKNIRNLLSHVKFYMEV